MYYTPSDRQRDIAVLKFYELDHHEWDRKAIDYETITFKHRRTGKIQRLRY